jgi:hypothetical protein
VSDPCQSFPPWPAVHGCGGGAVIPCNYTVVVKNNCDGSTALALINTAILKLAEKTVLQVKFI